MSAVNMSVQDVLHTHILGAKANLNLEMIRLTCGLISSEDAFAGSDNALGDFLQLLLLLGSERWVLVSHDAYCSKQPERVRKNTK